MLYHNTSSITAVHYLGDMYIVGDVELRSDLEVYGNLLGTGGLHIEGFTLYCYCTNNNQYSEGIDCDLYIENGVFNGYECHLNSNIYIKGGDCTVTGDVTIYGDIYVHDGTFLSYGMLTVNGNIYAEHGLFQINGVLFLSGRLVQGDGDVKVNFIVPI